MNTYYEKLLPVLTPDRAQYLLTRGLDGPRVIQANGDVGATHPFVVGVQIPLLKVCPSKHGQLGSDALCAAVCVKQLYFKNLHTLKYEVVDVSLLDGARFFNEISGRWESQVLRLELEYTFDGEEEPSKFTICGTLNRAQAELLIADQVIKTPTGEHLRLSGFTLSADRAITVWPHAA